MGKVKMDFAATMAPRRKDVPKIIESLPDDQLEELLGDYILDTRSLAIC
jgi:hypothetical protein